jgi:hypothetical protein
MTNDCPACADRQKCYQNSSQSTTNATLIITFASTATNVIITTNFTSTAAVYNTFPALGGQHGLDNVTICLASFPGKHGKG